MIEKKNCDYEKSHDMNKKSNSYERENQPSNYYSIKKIVKNPMIQYFCIAPLFDNFSLT